AQQPAREVGAAAARVDERAGLVARDRVGREVAARQVLLEGDAHGGIEREPRVAGTDLSLRAGERVLLARARMEENRKVLADAPIPERLEVLRRRADDHEVAFLDGQAEQGVPDRAA